MLAGLRERWGTSYDASYNQDLADIVGNYVVGGGHVIVVEDESEIVATGALVPDGVDGGRIVRMSVATSHRRQGFGRMVVEELISRARACGMAEVRVLTDTPWLSAIELYRSCGFEEVGRDDTDTHFVMDLRSP